MEMMIKESAPVSVKHDSLLQEVMEECDNEVKGLMKEFSPARLLWDQQKEAIAKGKAMRWHPCIIRFCIALQNKSKAAYNLMRDSGFFRLPHPTTLHPYSHFGSITTGVNTDLLQRITADYISRDMPTHHRDVSLLYDEMKIKAGLVYSEGLGSIVGFVDVGSIGNEILAFERKCRKDDQIPVATHVMVCMVRGIFTSLHAPIGYYPSTGVTSHQLYPLIWEAVLLLEASGFTVRALVSDGASQNRKFYRLNRAHDDTSRDVFCTPSPVDFSRKVYFFADVPHLIKTTRNNWENSGYNNNTRKLHYQKQEIKWTHLLQLYEWDIGYDRTAPGLRRMHKLTYEHLHLSPVLRMRVYLAAQVLSTTVANALASFGRHDTKSTEMFVRSMDQFFDCLNISNLYEGRNKRKPALEPYKSVDDWRFEWLSRDFLGFLDDWEEEANSHHELEKQVRNKLCLSRETLEGLRMTVHSFVELAKLLLRSPGVDFILSAKFNQDPLEMYFSKQRGAGGSSDNPTVEQFGHNMFSLYTASSCLKSSKKGNCRADNSAPETVLDNTPLPKRPKRK